MEYLSAYNQDVQLLAILDNAGEIGYELKHNDLWTGSFTLPAGDEKNAYCAAHNLIRLPDGPRKTGLFRIIGMPSSDETGLGGLKTYSLEHVMATLLDDVLFGYHEIGGLGIHTREVMQYILDRQTVQRWQLGDVEFDDQFQYHFENVSLLSALLSLGEVLSEEYTWDFDTETTPWTVNLRKADDTPGCGIHYGRNLVGIEKTMDASALITRLYPLGYGEGVNQLTIREANGGTPYIDADTIDVWGVKCSVWTDTRIEEAGLLKARAAQVLEGYKNPYITYTAKAVDLYNLTGYSWDDFMPGKLVRVMDGEHGINFEARIVQVSKRDVNGDPGDIEITIANAPRDAADSINTLADRVGIGELYSQGATNLFAIPFADNADPDHPAVMRVYVPGGLVRINKMLLTWQTAAFRAYETATESGGASTQTSTDGGGSTYTSSVQGEATYTSDYGDQTYQTSETEPQATRSTTTESEKTHTSSSGGGSTETTESGGSAQVSTPTTVIRAGTTSVAKDAGDGGTMSITGVASPKTSEDGSHAHTMHSHSHSIKHSHSLAWGHYHATSSSFAPGDNTRGISGNDTPKTLSSEANSGSKQSEMYDAGAHTHTVNSHSHNMAHYHDISSLTIPAMDVSIPGHSHSVSIGSHSHTVTIPAHSHDVTIPAHSHEVRMNAHRHEVTIPEHRHDVEIPDHSHNVEIPDHTHGIEFGIYEGGSAGSVVIRVDGEDVPESAYTDPETRQTLDEIDVSAWLNKDDNGKITRNAWHTIEIVPDSLTRIEASLFAQCFIQSVGGGDF